MCSAEAQRKAEPQIKNIVQSKNTYRMARMISNVAFVPLANCRIEAQTWTILFSSRGKAA